jgi:hypothetical protein
VDAGLRAHPSLGAAAAARSRTAGGICNRYCYRNRKTSVTETDSKGRTSR